MIRLLIAEDDPVMWRLYEIVFGRESGIEAVIIKKDWDRLADTYDWSTVDVALVDQYLESYRGSELLSWLRERHPEIRRIMYTGDTSITKACSNADVVLYKPAGPQELVDLVRGA